MNKLQISANHSPHIFGGCLNQKIQIWKSRNLITGCEIFSAPSWFAKWVVAMLCGSIAVNGPNIQNQGYGPLTHLIILKKKKKNRPCYNLLSAAIPSNLLSTLFQGSLEVKTDLTVSSSKEYLLIWWWDLKYLLVKTNLVSRALLVKIVCEWTAYDVCGDKFQFKSKAFQVLHDACLLAELMTWSAAYRAKTTPPPHQREDCAPNGL